MDLAARKLRFVAAGRMVVVFHDMAGAREIVHVDWLPEPVDVEFDLYEDQWPDRMQAPPALFAPIIAAATGLAVGSTAVTVLSTIASVVVGAAVSLGLSLIQRALFGKGNENLGLLPPADVPVRQLVKQATPRKRYVYGQALVGGAFCYLNKNPPYLISQFLVAAHACESLEAIYVNRFRCEFNSNGESITPRFRGGGVPYLEISTRLGDADQAIDPLLAAEFTEIPSTFRQRGQTVVTLKAYYGVDFDDHEDVWGQGGAFQPAFLMKGKKVHDPRLSSDPDDATAYVWSDNWALCLADWMRSSYGGRKMSSQVDWDAIAEEADICDQGIGLSDGNVEKRYTLNGGFLSDENPFRVAEAMLSAAGESACLWRRGAFAPKADVPRSTVRTLTEADLIGGFTFRSARPRREVLNTVRSEFVYPDRGYKSALTPPLIDSALVTSDGQSLEQTVVRPFVAGEERAQRLDKITLRRSRLGRELYISVGIEHLALEVGDHVGIEFENFPQVNGTYVIRTASAGGLGRTLELTMQEIATDEVHEWDASTEVQDTTLVEIINPETV